VRRVFKKVVRVEKINRTSGKPRARRGAVFML
jgi:hypothetical protein